MNMKTEAIRIVEDFGFRVFPVTQPSSASSSPGKRPLIPAWQESASKSRDQIGEWWGRWPEANIGVATGRGSDIWVLDVDRKSGGMDSLTDLAARLGTGSFETLTAVTGSGGLHFYFRWNPLFEIRNSAGDIGPGLDVRGEGGYVVAPPSLHVCGNRYAWKG